MARQKKTLEEIITACTNVFREKGYYQTSINDLANECELTKGALYHHFDSKEEIMETCLKDVCKKYDTLLLEIAYDEDLNHRQRLEKLATVYYEHLVSKKTNSCILTKISVETAYLENQFTDIIGEYYKKLENALVTIFNSKYDNDVAVKLAKNSIVDIEGGIVLKGMYNDISYLKEAINRVKERY